MVVVLVFFFYVIRFGPCMSIFQQARASTRAHSHPVELLANKLSWQLF